MLEDDGGPDVAQLRKERLGRARKTFLIICLGALLIVASIFCGFWALDIRINTRDDKLQSEAVTIASRLRSLPQNQWKQELEQADSPDRVLGALDEGYVITYRGTTPQTFTNVERDNFPARNMWVISTNRRPPNIVLGPYVLNDLKK